MQMAKAEEMLQEVCIAYELTFIENSLPDAATKTLENSNSQVVRR